MASSFAPRSALTADEDQSRRLIADALVLLHDVEVIHLMHSGTPQAHRLTPGVRVLSNGTLQYDQFEGEAPAAGSEKHASDN